MRLQLLTMEQKIEVSFLPSNSSKNLLCQNNSRHLMEIGNWKIGLELSLHCSSSTVGFAFFREASEKEVSSYLVNIPNNWMKSVAPVLNAFCIVKKRYDYGFAPALSPKQNHTWLPVRNFKNWWLWFCTLKCFVGIYLREYFFCFRKACIN